MDKEQFGHFIAEQRKLKNMTQAYLAEKLHVSTAAVSKWERGICLPELTKLEDLADAFDLSLMELMQCRKNEAPIPSFNAEDVQDVLHSTVRLSGDEIKKNRKKVLSLKICLCVAVAAALFAGFLFFSRPMTLSQLYPMLKIDECSNMNGYYAEGLQENVSGFSLERSDEDFWRLLMLLNEQEYRRSLKDLLPRGTKFHRMGDGDDVWWELSLRFDEFTMPDGSISSGFLRFENWYGDLEIFFDGDPYACYVDDPGLYDAVFGIIGTL